MHWRRLARRLVFTSSILAGLLLPREAAAQSSVSRLEVGADASVLGVTQAPHAPAFGARFDVNITPTLALETRVSRLSLPLGIGAAAQMTSGVRANLLRGRHVTLYGLALPGVIHEFSPKALLTTEDGTQYIPFAPTHFVLDLGIGLKLTPIRRLTARIEINRDLHASPEVRDTTLTPGGTPVVTTYRMPIAGAWNLHVGASYGLGATVVSTQPVPAPGRWTVGGQLGYTISTNAAVNSAAGLFVSYRLSPWCEIDGGGSGFLRDTLPSSVYEGGRVVQAVGGIKLGVRDGRFGVFFKARGGVHHETRVVNLNVGPGFHGVTMGVLDLGGVVETSVARRWLLRVDVGEALAFSPSPFGSNLGGPKIYGLPVRIGVGWRF